MLYHWCGLLLILLPCLDSRHDLCEVGQLDAHQNYILSTQRVERLKVIAHACLIRGPVPCEASRSLAASVCLKEAGRRHVRK